jgi:hypothetical protein
MRRDVSGHARDFDDAFFAAGGVEKLSAWFRANEEKCAVVPGSARWGLVLRGHRRLFALD